MHYIKTKMAFVAAVAVATIGCYESDFPLDSSPRVPVEAALRGTWRCLPSNGDPDEQPATVVVDVPRDRVYAITWQESGSRPEHYEAYGSSVRLPGLLNVHQIDKGSAPGTWQFVRYEFLRPSVLQLQVVQEQALAGVQKSPAALRAAIERLRTKPELLSDFCVCARAKVG